MADTLERTSPLQPWAARFARLPDAVAVAEEPFVTMVELRVDPSGPGATAAAGLLGVELPTAPSTYAKSADTTVIWLGPDEWLVTGTSLAGSQLEARLRGPHCRDVLGKGTPIDLHPNVFGGAAAAQTALGRTGVILLAVDGSGTDYRILVRSSFARYLADWLLDAAEEYLL